MKKYIRKKVEVQCSHCNITFEKDLSEVKRNEKIGRKNYCSMSCAKKEPANIEHISKFKNTDLSKLNPSNIRDEFTPFREHLRRAKRRDEQCDLDLEHLKEVWDKQQGICPYSKVKLEYVNEGKTNSKIYTMSLDRKDSSKGYIKGNVQFVSIAINLMKSNMDEKELQELLTILKE